MTPKGCVTTPWCSNKVHPSVRLSVCPSVRLSVRPGSIRDPSGSVRVRPGPSGSVWVRLGPSGSVWVRPVRPSVRPSALFLRLYSEVRMMYWWGYETRVWLTVWARPTLTSAVSGCTCTVRVDVDCSRVCVYPVSAIQYPVSAILDICKYVQFCVCAIPRYPKYPVSAILHI